MAIHRWRAVIDFYAPETRDDATRIKLANLIASQFTKLVGAGEGGAAVEATR